MDIPYTSQPFLESPPVTETRTYSMHVPMALVLGRVVVWLRNQTKLGQRPFAAEMGIPHSTLAWVEQGRTKLDFHLVRELERVLIVRGVLIERGDLHQIADAAFASLDGLGIEVRPGRAKEGEQKAYKAGGFEVDQGGLDPLLGGILTAYFHGPA